METINSKSMSNEEIYLFLKNNNDLKFSEEEIHYVLSAPNKLYPQIVYELSKNNHLPFSDRPESLFIFKNYSNFTEEDFFYFCEAIKKQIERDFNDFYFVIHLFFEKLLLFDALKNLLFFLLDIGDYKIREFIIGFDICNKIMQINLDNLENRVFFMKFWVKIVDIRSSIILNEALSLKIKRTIKIRKDCTYFFKYWADSADNPLKELFFLESQQ